MTGEGVPEAGTQFIASSDATCAIVDAWTKILLVADGPMLVQQTHQLLIMPR